MMTPKEQTELVRRFTRNVKLTNASLEAKEIIYAGLLEGLEQVEKFSDKNITGFCSILDREIYKRRKKN
jgi:hypothetical protein